MNNEIAEVFNELSLKLDDLGIKAADIAERLDEQRKRYGKTSELLERELEKTLEEKNKVQRETEHLGRFLFHVRMAKGKHLR